MVSVQEASHFLEEILEMPKAWKDWIENDPLHFLRRHAIRIPFQNISMASVDFEQRKPPTEDEIIIQGLSGKGGCCINLNYFTKMVFETLGLDSFVIQGTHYSAPIEGTHCMVVVKLDNLNELFLVEVGGAYPILEPIPMLKLPFKILAAGGFPYEFREISPGIIGRFHIGGGLLGGAYIDKKEALRTSWDLKPREFSEFHYPMKETFTNPNNSMLLRNPMIYRYFSKEEAQQILPQSYHLINSFELDLKNEINIQNVEEPKDFIFIFKRLIIIGDSSSRKIIKGFDSYEKMIPEIKKYFPTLDLIEIEIALAVFNQYEVIPSVYDTIL